MFRYAFSAAFAASLMLICVSAKSEWIPLREQPQPQAQMGTYFFDPSDMVNKNGFITYRILISIKDAANSKLNYNSAVVWFSTDCNRKMSKLINEDYYRHESMASGKPDWSIRSQGAEEHETPQNTEIGAAILAACK